MVWTIVLRRIRPHLDLHKPASLWGAIMGLSPHEAIFLHGTIADMDLVDLIIASLDVKGAFPNTPWLLPEAVWKRMGLPFYHFASGYIRNRKYTVRTGAGLTPFLEPGSAVPEGGAEGPFLYLFVKLPLGLIIEQDYPAYAPSSCAASAPAWTPTYPPASGGPSRAGPHTRPFSSRTRSPTWTW